MNIASSYDAGEAWNLMEGMLSESWNDEWVESVLRRLNGRSRGHRSMARQRRSHDGDGQYSRADEALPKLHAVSPPENSVCPSAYHMHIAHVLVID